ncbi:hypothetical protein BaRGS_00010051 [Batillaria attramentaria]|uniref:Uncharacterized protein n=1 Tax=Batillaria attramentaria TaxID=370345 RepID=A0ABD0LGF8_9CAEN
MAEGAHSAELGCLTGAGNSVKSVWGVREKVAVHVHVALCEERDPVRGVCQLGWFRAAVQTPCREMLVGLGKGCLRFEQWKLERILPRVQLQSALSALICRLDGLRFGGELMTVSRALEALTALPSAVAVTVYWLGRVVSQSFPGPKLDQSAFSALVHNQNRHSQHLVSDSSLRRDSSNSWESNGQSSAYGSHEGSNSHSSVKETIDHAPRHVRDGSYDSYTSYGKGSEDSLDEHVFDVDENGMPIPRYSSATALNRSGHGREGRGAAEGSTMYGDRNSAMYRSSPDLFHSKRRSSSTDSGDGSFHGSHSRQSSDSTEMYPTRRFSAQMPTRKTSVSADPLQFIKSKGATDLAVTAEEQIRLAAETKKIKFAGSVSEEDTDVDWQSNLNSWKNRRKSQSERSYQLKEELEEMEREKEEPKSSVQTTKTFSQMQQERERRKSAGTKHFYPIADEEEDDDIFSSTSAKKQESSPNKTSSRFQSSTPSRDDRGNSTTGVLAFTWDIASGENSTSDRPTASDTRQRRSGLHSDRDAVQKSYTETKESAPRNGAGVANSGSSRSQSKISNILKNFEKKDEDSVRPRSGVEHSVNVSDRKKSFENSGSRSSGNGVDSYRSWSISQEKQPESRSTRTDTSRAAPAVYASSRQSGKDFVEKTIKISQKPNNEKGFGFTLAGGADKRQPVVVEKVGLGSAADICELQTKDEVVAINGESVSGLTLADLNQKVKGAVRVGQIELRVKRVLGSGRGDFDEEEDFLSSEEEFDTPDRSVSKSSSVRAENSFDSLDSREEQQAKTEVEQQPWLEEQNTPSSISSSQMTRRGGPTSTSSDSGYDAQTYPSYSNDDDTSQSQVTEDHHPPPAPATRQKHFYPYEEEEDNSSFLDSQPAGWNSQPQHRGDNSEEQREAEVTSSQQVQVESRPSITIRREVVNAVHDDDTKPVASTDQRRTSQTDDNSDFGPPAALRKWQRQRPQPDYTFESDEPQTNFYSKMRLSSTLPRSSAKPTDSDVGQFSKDDSSLDREGAVHSKPPTERSERRFNLADERKRMEDWNQKQEQERQPVDVQASQSGNAIELQFPFDKRKYEEERDQIQHQYQSDLQRAADAERQKQDRERELLEPEMEKMKLLEERRAQRQARLLQYAQDAADTTTSPSRQEAPPQQHTSIWSTQLPGNRTSSTQPGMLVIDPRNRGEDSGQTGEAVFQLKINQMDTPHGLVIRPEVMQSLQSVGPSPLDLEAERERIRQVERERIRQEELQKIEAERRQKEEEEMRRIRTMEEQLRQQQEMLARQEEELRREQQRLERERQQLQQQTAPPPQPPQAHPSSQDTIHFETVTSKVRGGSPAYTSTVVTGPRRSEGHPQMSGRGSRDGGSGYGSGYGSRRSEPAWDGGRNQGVVRQENSWRGGGGGGHQNVSASQSSLPKWPPGNSEQDQLSNAHPHDPMRRQLSREDMVAMNRKPTPLQAKPPSPTSIPSNQTSGSGPIVREAPSKGQLHSLNSVPRAKIRNPEGWIGSPRDMDDLSNFSDHSGSSREGRSQPAAAPRRSEGFRGQLGGPQDHWLIQEAERRRLHDSGDRHGPSRAQFSGPIKPHTDSFGNRWRDDSGGQDPRSSPNMPAQIRQTLLQKTAGARGSTGSNYSQELNPPGSSSPHHSRGSPNTSMSQTLPPNFQYDYGQPSRPDAMPPSHRAPSPDGRRENGGVSLSGKQRCSHCSQELGFGAAMVIESLGLYYHVQCFKCCVCRTPLGNGVEGADVRVRVNKLHCPNCYSNDEGIRKAGNF